MTQQKAQAEINRFVAGFISDASPLTFPENASLVDINMELNADGSRQRSLGMDYEDLFQTISTTISGSLTNIATGAYRWENVGGDPQKVIICVQFGNQVKFFDGDSTPLSAGLISTRNFSSSSHSQGFSFTSVDGNLIIATGTNAITIVEYSNGSLSFSTDIIKVRDFFGVEDKSGSIDLTVSSGLQFRPTSLTDNHLYNLRNQGFGIPRMPEANETVNDPITNFRNRHNLEKGSYKFPSNSDSVTPYLYANAGRDEDRLSRRYVSKDGIKNPLGNTRAPQGYFIIDLLNRGDSRISEAKNNEQRYPELTYNISSLKKDSTPGGATVVGEFAGRVWYGGFSGEVIDGDSKSPRLSSYIAFSQLVTNPSMITQCYQSGDPTSDSEPDIIDTDGGYIRLNNAYGICGLINLGKSLMVVAANGVWRVYGGNDSGFSATNYVVEKITDKGARGPNSVVEVENTLLFWADDGIYWVKQNEFGDWTAESLTQNRIQKFYNEIAIEYKQNCVGVYDSYRRKVRWLYRNRINPTAPQKELVFDVNLNAFYERHISQIDNGILPIVVTSFKTNVFKATQSVSAVTVEGINVTVSSGIVTVTENVRSSESDLYEVVYVVVSQIHPTISYTFASYTDTDFLDWKSVDGVGVDAPATLITGTATGGDTMRFKQVPYLYVHSRRTEDGFVTDVNGDFVPTNQSSCLVRSIWDWTNSANSNKWSTPFQAYRYKRVYFPTGINDPFDTGYETIVTKNKLRGRGRAISLMFSSSPGKEMHIYGWSLVVAANSNV
jgi:hypothetical protein